MKREARHWLTFRHNVKIPLNWFRYLRLFGNIIWNDRTDEEGWMDAEDWKNRGRKRKKRGKERKWKIVIDLALDEKLKQLNCEIYIWFQMIILATLIWAQVERKQLLQSLRKQVIRRELQLVYRSHPLPDSHSTLARTNCGGCHWMLFDTSSFAEAEFQTRWARLASDCSRRWQNCVTKYETKFGYFSLNSQRLLWVWHNNNASQ